MTAILVHGGAGPVASEDSPDELAQRTLAAARRGYAVLERGGSALDAVVEAAVALEDDPHFNAGTGATVNSQGDMELDASVMVGATLSCGAVAGVQTVKNPVQLARAVMERTPHVLFAGPAADQLARALGFPAIDPRELLTDRVRRKWESHRAGAEHGTIGAVARDQQGSVAAATSTGGMFLKQAGRVGDSPLIGCGTYADDLGGAASATGHGESIIKVALCKRAVDLMREGRAAPQAATLALAELARVQGQGGLITVDRKGGLGLAFNTARMARAWLSTAGEGCGFLPGAAPPTNS